MTSQLSFNLSAWELNEKATVLIGLHQYDRSLEFAQKAISEDPNWDIPYQTAAKSLLKLFQYTVASEYAQQSIKTNPENSIGYHLASVAEMNLNGATEKAFELAETALSLHPDHASYYGFLGLLYWMRQRFETAQAYAQKGLVIDPENRACLYTSILAYAGDSKGNLATRTAESAMTLNPEDIASWFALSQAFISTGEYEKAIEAGHQALRLNPESEQLRKYLVLLYQASQPPASWFRPAVMPTIRIVSPILLLGSAFYFSFQVFKNKSGDEISVAMNLFAIAFFKYTFLSAFGLFCFVYALRMLSSIIALLRNKGRDLMLKGELYSTCLFLVAFISFIPFCFTGKAHYLIIPIAFTITGHFLGKFAFKLNKRFPSIL